MDPLKEYLARKTQNPPQKSNTDPIVRTDPKTGEKELVVNPFEYPSGRMDDPNNPARNLSVMTEHGDPVTVIKTISDRQFRKITGEQPEGEGHAISVMSPGLTTQPLISFTPDDISRSLGDPKIRVIEGGSGVPDVTPGINPYTSTNSLSMSSLLAPGAADSRGHSTTENYDDLKRRMGNYHVTLDNNTLDVLLPADVTENFSGANRISIGGVPGVAAIPRRVDARVDQDEAPSGFSGNDNGPIGTKRPVRTMSWDGQMDK